MPRNNSATFAIFLMLMIASAGASAQTTNERLEELEQEIEQGREHLAEQEATYQRLTAEMDGMRQRSIDIAEEIQSLEARSLLIETRVMTLREEEGLAVIDLDRRRISLVDILAALQSLERNKPPAILVRPDDAVEAARSAMLLGSVLPELEAQAAGLRTQLEALTTLRENIEAEQAQLALTAQALTLEEASLDELLASRESLASELAATVTSERRQLAQFASEAQDIRGLINRLTRVFSDATPLMRPTPEARSNPRSAPSPGPLGRFAQALGTLRMPVIGRVLGRFGETLGSGTHAQGVAVSTRVGARVVAPFDSEIVFAAPYRGYGQLLILSPGDGYLVLLSGLERIDGVVGQQLLTGEPIGIMGSGILAPNVRRWAVSEDAVREGQPILYLEVREDGEPVDPLPWFREDQWRSDRS